MNNWWTVNKLSGKVKQENIILTIITKTVEYNICITYDNFNKLLNNIIKQALICYFGHHLPNEKSKTQKMNYLTPTNF